MNMNMMKKEELCMGALCGLALGFLMGKLFCAKKKRRSGLIKRMLRLAEYVIGSLGDTLGF
ncbi:MAG: hypothetical protein II794_02695 [Oscillospiraceae bacterium]|nr:hypothetical protein [Oscillospiraceae bacterium]